MRSILVGICSLLFTSLLVGAVDIPVSHAVTNIDGAWTTLNGGSPPAGRREYAAVYDRVHKRYVMFAGFTNEPGNGYYLFNEVWMLSLDGTPSWSHVSIPGLVPGERHSPQWGYDPARNRLIVFGGYGSHLPGYPWDYLNDVWELKLNGNPSWTELSPSGAAPGGRLAGAAVFDVLHQRFVGFGGTAGLPTDTWQLDMKGQPVWSTVATNGIQPPGGYGMTSVFDPVRNRMIIFGGSTSEQYYGAQNNTWELDLKPAIPVWRQLNPSGYAPSPRRSLTSIYDPRRDRMVIFGGAIVFAPGNLAFYNDTYALSLSSGDGAWSLLAPDGAYPGVRDIMSAAYDPRGDRMVLFGGWSGTSILGDTQFLTWDDAGNNATASGSTDVDNGVALLDWDTENTVSRIGAVYRREANTEWTSIGTFEADGLGHVSFQDNAITEGHTYGYQIVVSSEAGDELVGETWMASPTGVGNTPKAALALRVTPNPATGPFVASFSGASNGPARLEMFNVQGQRVLSREVSGTGGSSRIELGDAKSFASGVYYLRLTQSGRSTTSRFVLVR